jgi:hypothetical protein
MNSSARDIASFKRRAEGASAAMRDAKGMIALYCYDDARFYITRAIEIAGAAGRDGLVARLRQQRDQIQTQYDVQLEGVGSGIDRWENEGGAPKRIVDKIGMI